MRQHLEDAARALFDEHGYEATTVEMIAAEAFVSPRTFHRYFETKSGVAVEPARRLIDRVAGSVSPSASIVELTDQLCDAVEDAVADGDLVWCVQLHRDHPELMDEAPVWRRRWAERLAFALARSDGRASPDVVDRTRSALAVQVAAVAVDEWILRRPRHTYRALVAEVVAALHEHLDVSDRR